MYNIDRLIKRIDELKNPSVVGLDPTTAMIPASVSNHFIRVHGRSAKGVAEMFRVYNMAIMDAVANIVPAVKPQIAMYERYGVEGLKCYIETAAYAVKKGLYVIGDIKRGDISSTAEAYAGHLSGPELSFEGENIDSGRGDTNHLSGVTQNEKPSGAGISPDEDLWREDAITVNPYFGTDGIAPFTDACRRTGKSIYILVKTSNKSSAEIQDVMVSEGNAQPVPLYERIGKFVDIWGTELIGEYGYSAVGAVVGATHPEEGTRLRALMPNTFFLVPGYGAQGASAEDLKGFFDKDGSGCIVNSSRGIIAAWKKNAPIGNAVPSAEGKGALSTAFIEELTRLNLPEEAICSLANVATCAAEAATAMQSDLNQIFS